MTKTIKALMIAAGIMTIAGVANAAPTNPEIGGLCAGAGLGFARDVKELGRPDLAGTGYEVYNRQEARFKGNPVYEKNMRIAFNAKDNAQGRLNVLKGCVSQGY